MKAKVRKKKALYHVFLGDKLADNWQKYHEAKKAVKKAVAGAKATHYNDVYEKLMSRDGISTEDLPHPAVPTADPIHGSAHKVTVEETEEALRKMRSGKATGLDVLPADLWKSKLLYSAEWFTKFFNQVVAEKEVPDGWHGSTTIPIWKKNGSPADCSNYRPIRLVSHSMNIFELILDRRIREMVELSDK
ncbi:unnamed protein product [Heligmosomoides polygyrus]|uniref:Reverse transcriptase domain-containing protein n=1 Tax=Heligmosomoides polygyrus TaxID=6339 RepID=A0A183GD38_HELPZ|nr:unnamed protein product [Heligmosomoides polygyrus]